LEYGWFTVPAGNDEVVIYGGVGELTVIVKFWSSNCGIESVTRKVNSNKPEVMGVPEILPFEGLRSSPGGNAPLVTPQTSVPMPPVTEIVSLYATSDVPAGSDVVVIFGGVGKPIVIDNVFCADCCGVPESST